MFLYKTTAYTFPASSSTFVVYAMFKSSIFLALPLLEVQILQSL
jgi:hypothetical protein